MKFCKGFYLTLIAIGNFLQSFVLLAIRLFWGYQFFVSGFGKLSNIEHVIEFFKQLHIPMPVFNAYLVGGTECIGGLCLIVGLASRLVSIPLAITMTVALLTARETNGGTIFENPQSIVDQPPFAFLLTAILIFVFGPGKFSIDFLLEKFFFRRSAKYHNNSSR